MIRLYSETKEFGGYHIFDTVTGKLTYIDEAEFNRLKKITDSANCFQGFSDTHSAFFRRAYFQITRRCNLLCDHCFIKADSHQSDLDRNVAMQLAEYLGRKGLMEVRLTGGEPTIADSFIEIVEAFRRNNVYVSVGTNGLWPQKVKDFFKTHKNLWLVVSIDGAEEAHNSIRPGSYRTIIRNIQELREVNPDIRLRINTVLCKRNVNDMEHLAKLTKELNAESIVLIPLRTQVRTGEFLESMMTGREFRDAILRMAEYKEKYGIKFSTTVKHYAREHIVLDQIFTKTSSCAAGREGTNIDFSESRRKLILYGCSYCPASDPLAPEALRAPFTAGEIDYDNLEGIQPLWEDDHKWQLYRDLTHKSDECRSCEYFPSRCEGSCPTLNFDISQLDLAADVASQLKTQLQKNGEWYCYRQLDM